MKRIILAIITFLFLGTGYAQLSDSINRHFIIAIDGFTPYRQDVLVSDRTRATIEKVLFSYNISKKDYVSIVSYLIDLSFPDFETFAWIPRAVDGDILWRVLPSEKLLGFGSWDNIVARQHLNLLHTRQRPQIEGRRFFNCLASFQSAAKPYIIRKTKPIKKVCANETYLLMVTDEKVNGTDDNYQYEWKNISTVPGANLEGLEGQVFQTINTINRIFQYEPIRVLNQDKIVLADSHREPFVLVGYKINPTSIPSIQSISNIPVQLPVEKVRGGYSIELDLKSLSDKYAIEKMELTINSIDKKFVGNGASIEAFIKGNQLSEGDTITLRTWVKFEDGIYNGLTMNPYDKQYMSGFTIKQSVVFKDDAKIFGKIPMIDAIWWWFPNDIQSAVIVWDVIIVLVFIVIICFIAYRIFNVITRYVPSNEKIKINKFDGNHN